MGLLSFTVEAASFAAIAVKLDEHRPPNLVTLKIRGHTLWKQPVRQSGTGTMLEGARGGILLDPIDVRDRHYEPTLAPLAPQKLPEEGLLKVLRGSDPRWRLPRDQGDEGTCGGQALATLIDVQRILAPVPKAYPVSARMIYWAARLTTEGRATVDRTATGADTDDGVSLREVIKAFYNYGVCSERLWPYVPGDRQSEINFERAKDAKNISLGAYYRLRPNLNTYHAALHETGALLVSAELHDGWRHERVRANHGEIVPPGPNAGGGTLGLEKHAFVIVGYTPRGFLVLNCWGRDWGVWRPEPGRQDEVPEPVPGIALWRYEDWANAIMDGWVLRLGVGAAEAFEYSIGDQGLGFGAEGAVRSTPVHAILGNFLHLDDGRYVDHGAYISTKRTLSETKRLLIADARKPPYDGALLTFAGGLLGLTEAAGNVARWKRLAQDARWYPFTVFFCVDYVDAAKAVLDGVFREAEARVGKPGPRLDRVIEDRAHGVGRAFWRDIIHGAETAARPGGPFHDLVQAAAELVKLRPSFGLRVVGESEGAFALTALVRALHTDPSFRAEAEPFFAMLQSVDLIAPPLTYKEYSTLAHFLHAGWGPLRPDRRIFLHLPTIRDERMLSVPPYGKSYFELVWSAFQCRETVRDEPSVIERSTRARKAIASKWDLWKTAPRTTLVPIAWLQNHAQTEFPRPISQIQLIYRSDVGGRLSAILRRPAPSRRPTGSGI